MKTYRIKFERMDGTVELRSYRGETVDAAIDQLVADVRVGNILAAWKNEGGVKVRLF